MDRFYNQAYYTQLFYCPSNALIGALVRTFSIFLYIILDGYAYPKGHSRSSSIQLRSADTYKYKINLHSCDNHGIVCQYLILSE